MARFVKLSNSDSLIIEDISRNSTSGIYPGFFLLELLAEDQKNYSKAFLPLLVVDPFVIDPFNKTGEDKTPQLLE